MSAATVSPKRTRRVAPWTVYGILLLSIADAVVRNNVPAVMAFGTIVPSSRGNTRQCHQHQCNHHHHRPDRSGCGDSGTNLRASFPMEFSAVSDLISTYNYCLKYHYYPTQSVTNAVITVVGDGIAQTVEAVGSNSKEHSLGSNNDGNYSYDPKRGLVYFFKGLGSGIVWASWFDFAEVWSVELTQSVLSLSDTDVLGFATDATTTTTTTAAAATTTVGFEYASEYASGTTSGSELASAITTVLSLRVRAVRTAINIALEQFLVCPLVFSLWDIPFTAVLRGSTPRQIPNQIREKLPPLFVANAKVWTGVNLVTYNIPLEYRLLFTSAASIVSEAINAGITSKTITEEPPPMPLPSSRSTVSQPLRGTVPANANKAINATAIV